ncbi:hypothetical protein FO488_12870 [Geobacter sp. FeAm09]|nr:hypothetical protein FO488_12870 [Geobacter sp. FeAm09]
MLDNDSHSSSRHLLDGTAQTLRELTGGAIAELRIERVVVGVFFTGVKLSNGCGGVAYTPPAQIKRAGVEILKGSSQVIKGMEVTRVLAGELVGPFAEIVRLSTINALSVPFFNSGRYAVDSGNDISGFDQLFSGRRVCVVGAIIPLLKRLRSLGTAETVIIDQKEDTTFEASLGRRVSLGQTAEALARCETAVFTGASIANGSLPRLLAMVPADAAIAVVGPTAGFIPDELFRRNVALVGTVIMHDSDRALDVLAEGGGAYQLFGTCMRKINIRNVKRIRELHLAGSNQTKRRNAS